MFMSKDIPGIDGKSFEVKLSSDMFLKDPSKSVLIELDESPKGLSSGLYESLKSGAYSRPIPKYDKKTIDKIINAMFANKKASSMSDPDDPLTQKKESIYAEKEDTRSLWEQINDELKDADDK